MKKNSGSLIRRFAIATSALAALLCWGPAGAEELETTILNDGSAIAFGYNDSVKSSSGNIHIAVLGTPSSDPDNNSLRDVYYMLVSGSGKVLIDATKVSSTTGRWGRPHIALTSDKKAVITWNGNSAGAMRYVLVDATQDARNGGPADPADILEVDETVVGINASTGHNEMVIDDDDVVHVFKQTSSNLFYLSFLPNDGTGNPDIQFAEASIALASQRSTDPAVALDSDNNLHVLFRWADPADGLAPVAYMMVNGATGAVMIDATPLYDASAVLQHSAHFSIGVGSNDKVHAIYGDKRFTIDRDTYCDVCGTGGHIFYTRLDPSQAPRDGSASDMATLRDGDETQIWGVWYSRAFRNSSGDFDVFGTTGDSDESGDGRSMTYVRVTPTSAGATVGSPRVFTTGVMTPGFSKHFVSKAGGDVIWASGRYSIPFAQPVYPLVMAPISRFTGSSGGGGSVSPLALLALLFAGLARGLKAMAPRKTVLMMLAALLASGNAFAADLVTDVLNDGTTVGFGRPDSAVGADGNIHIVATGSLNPNPGSQDTVRDIYYMLVEPDGTVLIDATKITLTSAQYSGPQVVVTANGKASVTYKRPGAGLMTVLVDPSLDDRNGDAANPATVVTLAETTVSPTTGGGHHTTVRDPDGVTVHVVRATDSGILYSSYTAATGAVVTAETTVADSGRRGIAPAVGIDSDGNLHVLYQTNDSDGLDFDPAAYSMIDGNDGTVLIDKALLLDDSGIPQHSAHLSLVVDSNDKVHLIHGDVRFTIDRNSFCNTCGTGGDMFYNRINPARHPQNGGRGSIAQMREGSEVHLGGFWYSQAFRSSNGTFNLYSTAGGDDSNYGNMIYESFTPTSDGASVGRPRMATTSVQSTHWSKHYVTSVADRVIWVAGGYNIPLAQPSFPLVMAQVSTFRKLKAAGSSSSGGSGSGGMPPPSLLVLGLAGIAAALRRRRH